MSNFGDGFEGNSGNFITNTSHPVAAFFHIAFKVGMDSAKMTVHLPKRAAFLLGPPFSDRLHRSVRAQRLGYQQFRYFVCSVDHSVSCGLLDREGKVEIVVMSC
jgi:hypothetical protein